MKYLLTMAVITGLTAYVTHVQELGRECERVDGLLVRTTDGWQCITSAVVVAQ